MVTATAPAPAHRPAARSTITQSPRSIGKRLRSVAETAAGWFPLTPRGLLLAAVCAWAIKTIGFEQRDVILLSAGLVVLGWAAISLIVVLLAGVWYQVRPQLRSDEVLQLEAGEPSPTGYSLGLLSWLPVLQVEVWWVEPEGVEVTTRRQGGRIVEEATARTRGAHARIRRCIRVSDLFGFVRVIARRNSIQTVHIVPGGSAGSMPAPRSLRDGDGIADPTGAPQGDRVDQRRYVAGDPLKVVLWKVFARSGKLLVRTPERAIDEVDRIRAYFVSSDDAGALPSDEATAGVARAALEAGALGREFIFGADGNKHAADSVKDAISRIVDSASAHGQGASGLEAFLANNDDFGSGGCLLFVPARPGSWLQRVEHSLRARPGRFRVVVGIDGPSANTTRKLDWKKLFFQSVSPVVTADELKETCTRLRRAAAEVVVIDRASGRATELNI